MKMKPEISVDQKTLQEITLECKRALDRLDVVTPPLYASLFREFAMERGLKDIPDNAQSCAKIVETQISSLTQIGEKSDAHIERLDTTSKKALDAMERGDRRSLKKSIDETEALRREIEQLKESVYTDPLTKAYNRQWLDAHFLDKDGRITRSCHLAIIDLNYFKQINDTLGHVAGDKVLTYIASHLKTYHVPLVRYGGDEFLLIFEEGSKEAETTLNECRERLLRKKLKYQDKTFNVSFSYGITSCEANTLFYDAIESADSRMYKDKERIKKRIAPPLQLQNPSG